MEDGQAEQQDSSKEERHKRIVDSSDDEEYDETDESNALDEEHPDAGELYVLMHDTIRVSRTSRAKWFFSNLDRTVNLELEDQQETEMAVPDEKECAVIGCLPADSNASDSIKFKLRSLTDVNFVSRRYRFVFLLDLSPSAASVSSAMPFSPIESVIPWLRKSLEALSSGYNIPGSCGRVLDPEIYVTVIAWTSFLTVESQLVLCQGWKLLSNNINDLIDQVISRLHHLEEKISRSNKVVQRDIEHIRAESERIIGRLFDDTASNHAAATTTSMPVATSDAGFISMVRTGILALQLLPKNSRSSIIVVSDGTLAVPDINACDSLLNQLRTKTISLSFFLTLERSGPQSGLSRLPYLDLMRFLCKCTNGIFVDELPDLSFEENRNAFQRDFFCWRFCRPIAEQPFGAEKRDTDLHEITHFFKFPNADENSVKRKMDSDVFTSLESVLSCRLREGYAVNKVICSSDGNLEVNLSLPWKLSSLIHYILICPWAADKKKKGKRDLDSCRVNIYLEGDYDTIHDIICHKGKDFHSVDRNSVVKKFFTTLQHLTRVDKLIMHLDSFTNSKNTRDIPDSLLNGNPLFVMKQNSNDVELYSPDFTQLSFTHYWKPICSLDISIWHRWMHTHRINVLLTHDMPLPKHFVYPNNSGRFTPIQCRKASLMLTTMLKEFSTFTLVEGTTYIKFLTYKNEHERRTLDERDQHPKMFYIIKVTSKPPCVILWLAFPLGTCGILRHKQMNEIKENLTELKYQVRPMWNSEINRSQEDLQPREVPACYLMRKPIERILLRYEKVPQDFYNLFEPIHFLLAPRTGSPVMTNFRRLSLQNGPSRVGKMVSSVSSGIFMTLARYLRHERWVWQLKECSSISISFLSRLLSAMIKVRLKQGFKFSYSQNGIQTLILEMSVQTRRRREMEAESDETQTLLIQFVTFPPNHEYAVAEEFHSDDAEDNSSVVLETRIPTSIVTEVWVEPQDGILTAKDDICKELDQMTYEDIPSVLFGIDEKIVRTMASIEYVNGLCKATLSNDQAHKAKRAKKTSESARPFTPVPSIITSTVKTVQFSRDIVSLLSHASQIEILFSGLFQDFYQGDEEIVNLMDHLGSSSRSNAKLIETFIQELALLNDRELEITEEECANITSYLKGANRNQKLKLLNKFSKKTTTTHVKWRCLLKWIGPNHFFITIVPSTFSDMKTAFIDNQIDLNGQSALNMVTKAMPPANMSGLCRNDGMMEDSSDHHLSSSPSHPSNSTPNSRKRTQSIDNSDASPNLTGRRKSLSGPDNSENSMDKSVFRPRTHTISHIKRGGAVCDRGLLKSIGRGAKKDHVPQCRRERRTEQKRESLRQVGSPSLPVFMFNCQDQQMIELLMEQRENTSSDTINFLNSPENSKPLTDKIPEDATREKSAGMEENVSANSFKQVFDSQVKAIERAFIKSYVSVIFHSLQHHISVHTYDIQQAIDYCHDEGVMGVEITNFLLSICPHIDETKETFQFDELRSMTSPSTAESGCGTELARNHNFLQKKFEDLLNNSFDVVPSLGDIFFFKPEKHSCSSTSHFHKDDGTHGGTSSVGTSRQRRETGSTQVNDDELVEFRHCEELHNQSDGTIVADSRSNLEFTGPGSMSALSNIESEQSELSHDELDEPDTPFFLQLSISVRVGNKCLKNFPITNLPICFKDIFKDIKDGGDSVCLKDLSVSLDLLCLTIPIEQQESMENLLPVAGSFSSNLSSVRGRRRISHTRLSECSIQSSKKDSVSGVSVEFSSDDFESEFGENDDDMMDDFETTEGPPTERLNLPDAQKKALQALIDDLTWMMENEIISSLTRIDEVSTDTLLKVTKHIESSVSKPGCSVQRIPLSFVMGHTNSLKLFNDKLIKNLSLPNFQVRNIGGYLLFVQENESASNHPSCWLILEVKENEVVIFFQFQEGQMSNVIPWRQVYLQVVSTLKDKIRLTNQEMLLRDMHDTKMCNRLLEEENEDETWTNGGNTDDVPTMLEANLRIRPGHFACPMVWETRLILHPRLLVSSTGNESSSLGALALKSALDSFAVTNRNNMFVYMDDKKEVFYFKLICFSLSKPSKTNLKNGESEAPSRTSSMSGNSDNSKTSRRNLQESTTNSSTTSSLIGNPSSKSGLSSLQSSSNSGSKISCIDIKFYGVSKPGENIMVDFVQFLQSKLDEGVVDILSTMLLRNKMSKLTREDVEFLQKPSADPNAVIYYAMPSFFNGHLNYVMHYLRQNLLLELLLKPRFQSERVKFRNPNWNGKDDPLTDTFLFNQAASRMASNRGLACISISLKTCENEGSTGEKEPIRDNEFISKKSLYNINKSRHLLNISPTEENHNLTCAKMEIRLWEQGKVDREKLLDHIEASAKHALWETLTECCMISEPVVQRKSNVTKFKHCYGLMSLPYSWLTNGWMQMGSELKTPSLFQHQNEIAPKCSLKHLMKEIILLSRQSFSSVEPFVFLNGSDGLSYAIEKMSSTHSISSSSQFEIMIKPVKLSCSMSAAHSILKFKPGGCDHSKSVPQTPSVSSPVGSMQSSPNMSTESRSRQDFIPRQSLIMIKGSTEKLELLAYNLAKENFDSYAKQLCSLSHWLGLRSSLLSSIYFQKCGLFHNQVMTRKRSPISLSMQLVEDLVHRVTPPNSRSQDSTSRSSKQTELSLLYAFKDAQAPHIMQPSSNRNAPANALIQSKDAVSLHGRQMLRLSHSVQEKLARLFVFFQKRGGNVLTEEGMAFLIKHSRIVSFCHTPLLFMPKWRYEAHLPRSDGNTEADFQRVNKVFRGYLSDEKNNQDLIELYIHEYCQYVQTLGFSIVNLRNAKNYPQKHRKFLQKSVPAGILLFEIGICEPFFYTRLYTLEESRLPTKKFRPKPASSFTAGLVDECDKVKSMLHVHSFTYDFHLRILQGVIGGRPMPIRPGYNFVNFLADFLKYYSKGPNYARNLVRAHSLEYKTVSVSPEQLFNYLLSHEATFGFKVMRVEPVMVEKGGQFKCDYILAKQESHAIQYINFDNDPISHTTENFDLTIIVSMNKSASSKEAQKLVLNFFVVLTNQRDLFPAKGKVDYPQKKGVFKPVDNFVPEKSGILDADDIITIRNENVRYVGYYSAHENALESSLNQKMEDVKAFLLHSLSNAGFECRRDSLWNTLMNSDNDQGVLDEAQFHELLALTSVKPVSGCFDKLDSGRAPSLIKDLKQHYGKRHKTFQCNGKDLLVLLDCKTVHSCILVEISSEKSTFQFEIYQMGKTPEHLNDVVGIEIVRDIKKTFCYHMWTETMQSF